MNNIIYTVEVRETHVQLVKITASSLDEAIKFVKAGGGGYTNDTHLHVSYSAWVERRDKRSPYQTPQ